MGSGTVDRGTATQGSFDFRGGRGIIVQLHIARFSLGSMFVLGSVSWLKGPASFAVAVMQKDSDSMRP